MTHGQRETNTDLISPRAGLQRVSHIPIMAVCFLRTPKNNERKSDRTPPVEKGSTKLEKHTNLKLIEQAYLR